MDDPVDLVSQSLATDARDPFDRRVDDQAAELLTQLRSGALDNADPAIGLEIEGYLVDGDGHLTPLDGGTFEEVGVNRELGLHNIEINTPASVFDEAGIEAQATAVRERFGAAQRIAAESGCTPVLDAMWTIPPRDGSRTYLSAVSETDGLTFAENMAASPRYYALDNAIRDQAGGEIDLDLPGATFSVPTILVESLTSSIQPHLQVPEAAAFPAYYNTAIRTLGPVLALATNSPFLPADLYANVDPETVLDETCHELRVPVFEQSINAGDEPGKVRFPEAVTDHEDVVQRVVADRTVAPFLREWITDEEKTSFADTVWEFDHKHSTYWRWIRPVIGGDAIDETNTERSLRIEYRPLPTQPSVRDIVGLQCLVAGLVHGLVVAEHPLRELDWDAARRSFYSAVRHGLDADLTWVTAAGDRTGDLERVYAEVFRFARRGLRDRGVADATIAHYLDPIEARWETRTTPSIWKREAVARRVADGADIGTAIEGMQREYLDRQGTPFTDWH